MHHVAVRHHDYHFLGPAFGDEVVQYHIELADLGPCLLGVGGAADKVEHRILLPALVIARRRVDHKWTICPQDIRAVCTVLELPVRDGTHAIEQRVGFSHALRRERRVRRHLQEARLEVLVGEHVLVERVRYLDSVDDETVWVDVRLVNLDSDAPDTVHVLLHRDIPLQELSGKLHHGGLRRPADESHGAAETVDQRGLERRGVRIDGRAHIVAEEREGGISIPAPELAIAGSVEMQVVRQVRKPG